MTRSTELDHYTVLGLPSPRSGRIVTSSNIKAAFRRVLLLHHPDKINDSGIVGHDLGTLDDPAGSSFGFKHSVDDICLARDILIDPVRRHSYDRELLRATALSGAVSPSGRLAGTSVSSKLRPMELEVVDLDDMVYDPVKERWTRECRCGNSKAYAVSEQDLTIETDAGNSEVLVGCGGCSLFARIAFEAVDMEEPSDSPHAHPRPS